MSSLYREQLLAHYRQPEHWGQLTDPDAQAELDNPTCGDRLEVQLSFDQSGQRVQEVAFQGEGCAISIASASLLGGLIEGQSLADIREFKQQTLLDALGIQPGPTRLRCALLSLSVVQAALKK